MSIALFAIIGAAIKANAAYWICFSVYCVFRLVKYIAYLIKMLED